MEHALLEFEDYLSIVAVADPFSVINGCFSNVLCAEGQSTKAMMGQLIGNLTNIVLDPVMILGIGMEIRGAAIATVIGNLVGTLYYILYFVRGKSLLSISIKKFTVREKVCISVLSIGIPASLSALLMCTSHMVLNRLMVGYGNLQLAGIGVATNIMKISGLVCMGMGQGIQPLVGYCAGSGDLPRCKKVIRFSLVFGTALSTVMAVFSYLFINQIVGAFLSDAAALNYGVRFSRIMILTSFLYGAFNVLTNAVQGFGAATASLIINSSRQGLIFIPLLFIMRAVFGMEGLVWTQPVCDIIAIIFVVVVYIYTAGRFEKDGGHEDSV